MDSEDTLNIQTASDQAVSETGDSELHDYEAEGLAIKVEGMKEGKIYPGQDAEYPTRNPSEDPTWAVRIVVIWMGITVFSILFILTLMILGIWYD